MSERDWREFDDALDRAIDALNAEHAPDTDYDGDGDFLALVDTVRQLRRLRPAAEPEPSFPARIMHLPMTVAADAPRLTRFPNGTGTVATEQQHERRSRGRRPLLAIAAVLDAVGICVVAGIVAGALVGGIGGRAAMRVSGYMYEREHPGQVAITQSSGEPVGQISLAGTLQLVVETALFDGVAGGLVYLLIAPWLPRRLWLRGLLFAALLALAGGWIVIDSANEDFQRLGSPLVNVTMFTLLIGTYGVAVAWVASRLERVTRIDEDGTRGRVAAVTGATVGIFGAFGLLVAALLSMLLIYIAAISLAALTTRAFAIAVALVTVAVALPFIRVMAALPPSHPIVKRLRSNSVKRLAGGSILVVIGVGAVLTLWSVVHIISG
jgi:hypothetical protein